MQSKAVRHSDQGLPNALDVQEGRRSVEEGPFVGDEAPHPLPEVGGTYSDLSGRHLGLAVCTEGWCGENTVAHLDGYSNDGHAKGSFCWAKSPALFHGENWVRFFKSTLSFAGRLCALLFQEPTRRPVFLQGVLQVTEQYHR